MSPLSRRDRCTVALTSYTFCSGNSSVKTSYWDITLTGVNHLREPIRWKDAAHTGWLDYWFCGFGTIRRTYTEKGIRRDYSITDQRNRPKTVVPLVKMQGTIRRLRRLRDENLVKRKLTSHKQRIKQIRRQRLGKVCCKGCSKARSPKAKQGNLR